MIRAGIRLWLGFVLAGFFLQAAAQVASQGASPIQSCPLNINFSGGNITHWEAYTGNNSGGNGPDAIKVRYDSTQQAPLGTIGGSAFPEFNLPGVNGIQVLTQAGTDLYGGFTTIPTIRGYSYGYSVLLGSTSVSAGHPTGNTNSNGQEGGYVRGISYTINVPAGPSTVPYTMTYAYAMVLENGTHVSDQQPVARATLSTMGGVIDCASPAYFLPTGGAAANGSGNELDTAAAVANGFSPSPMASPNLARDGADSGKYLRDIWTKGWTEVTFDLSAYRGQQVTLTFEADNCVPGGHFAYAYFALRNSCAGVLIDGDTLVCSNATATYSVPTLNGATYTWEVPPGWTIEGNGDSNSVSIKIGPGKGYVVSHETNSCANIVDSLLVDLYPAPLPQVAIDPADTTVCYGDKALLNATISAGTSYTFLGALPFSLGGGQAVSAVPFSIASAVTPLQTTDYILNVTNAGCPTVISDTFVVTVVQPISVNAGDDTLVVIGQPLVFGATSSDIYPDVFQWSPSVGLSNPGVWNPTGMYDGEFSSISYMVSATDSYGCTGTGSVTVTIAKTHPDILVPSAFTPGAKSNALFRPVCYGLSSLAYFRVYNRAGQLVFSTSQQGAGWDGRIQGILQAPGVFIWMAQGTDFTGKEIFKKGTVVLIR